MICAMSHQMIGRKEVKAFNESVDIDSMRSMLEKQNQVQIQTEFPALLSNALFLVLKELGQLIVVFDANGGRLEDADRIAECHDDGTDVFQCKSS